MNRGQWEHRKAGRGFSLIEVLIALIVMSVGMLGIAGLYVHGLQAGRTSLFRHQAVALAGDVSDRIRANPQGRTDYNDSTFTGSLAKSCLTDVCTAAEMAAYDKFFWDQQADDTLPDGDVTVTYTAPAGSGAPATYTVLVTWSEAGQDQPQYQVDFPVFEPAP